MVRVPRRHISVASPPLQRRNNWRGRTAEADRTLVHRDVPDDTEIIDRCYSVYRRCSHPNVKVHEQADQTLVFDTGNYALHQVTKPAMLLQDSLTFCFEKLRNKTTVNIDGAQLTHLQKLFDMLVASAHTSSAENILDRYGPSSYVKRYSQTPPPIFKSRPNTSQRRRINSSIVNKRAISTYVDEKLLSLDTDVGRVKAKILMARCYGKSRTLAFEFEYSGLAALNVLPFAIDYMSHELGSYYPLLQPLSGQATSFVFEKGCEQFLEVPSESLISEEVS